MSNSGFPPPDMAFHGMRPPLPPPPQFRPDLALPPNWESAFTPTGEIYYFNRLSGETTWIRPVGGIVPPLPPPVPPSSFMHVAAATAGNSMPDAAKVAEKSTKKPKKTKKPIPGTDWLLVRTSDGLEFYFEKSTKKSVWEMPEELKEPVQRLKEEEELERKRKLEEEENDENGAVKRLKGAEEEQQTTELTEEDLMWQLQQMDPEEIEAMGLNVGGEEPKGEDGTKDNSDEPKIPEPAVETAAAAAPPDHPQISDEEKIELFTKNIDPFSTWEKELPKFINDERYALVPHGKRKNLFNNFCRVKAEEIKANKPVSKAKEEFLSLLKEEATPKMYWEDFRRKAKNDRRFKLIKESKTRESMFKDYVRGLKKQKDASTGSSSRRREEEYKKLLRSTKEIKPGLRWRDAKLILEKDNRYHAIESKRVREDLFRDYLEELES
ncbi:hypothetical protein BX666DRAFT_2022839 [Dichotomocladium elegans]|nr:hypothetical protein BX666DRAFT_2022839 [Dichotomocladium elegans]